MLGIVAEKSDDAATARKDVRYHVSLHRDKVALFAEAPAATAAGAAAMATTTTTLTTTTAAPSDDEVAHALAGDGGCAHNSDAHASFLVTPVHALADAASGEGEGVLHTLLADVERHVYRRENVTLVHRGVNADAHLESVVLSLLRSVRPCAEYAMQIMADEVAKERQIQRLLQLEGEKEHGHTAGAAATTTIATATATATAATTSSSPSLRETTAAGRRCSTQSLPLSFALRARIHELQVNCGYTPARDRSAVRAALPYVVVSDAHDGDLVPPCTHGSRLVPLSFAANAPARRGPHVMRASLRERSVRSNSYLFAQQRRRSTLALMNELSSATSTRTYTPLRGHGWGGATVQFFVFNGVSSVMALPGVPRLEDLIRGFAVDFWLRTDLQASDGRRVLLHVMDGQQPEDVGQLLQISLDGGHDASASTSSASAAATATATATAATLRILVRDATNRVLEALVTLTNVNFCATPATFHHILLTLHSVDEGKLTCIVDGDDLEVRLVQQEHPIAFNTWPHRLFVGGYLDADNNPAQVLRGSVLELRFWNVATADEPQPVVRWPLLVNDDDGDKQLCEATHTITADHHETLLDLQRISEPAPACCPWFDGNLVINVGTMPLWGQLMHNWRIEVRFRTTVATRMMTLMGVTDHKLKMQSFGIVLNAEPVFARERFRFHELNTTLYVVDAFGACCSALLRGSERQSLVDGQWHTLVWKCVDSEANMFAVTVDGVPQDLLYVTREGATRFVEWSNWVCVGGHNERNWRVRRPFAGQIDRVYVSLRGHHYLTLPLKEGPGAYVMQDRSGHDNHGLLIRPRDGVVRRHNVVWLPSREHRGGGGGEGGDDAAHGPVTVYRNNAVAVAAVVFTCDTIVAAEGGGGDTPRDVIVDVLSDAAAQQQQQQQQQQQPLSLSSPALSSSPSSSVTAAATQPPPQWRTYYTLDEVTDDADEAARESRPGTRQPHHMPVQRHAAPRAGRQSWYVLPEACYRAVETATQLEACLNEALGAVARLPGHALFVIRIGDCYVTLLHLREPALPADATYDRNMLTWHYRYALAGSHGWHTRMLRRMLEGVERVLVADTLTPSIVAHLGRHRTPRMTDVNVDDAHHHRQQQQRQQRHDDGQNSNNGSSSGDDKDGVAASAVVRRLREAGRPWLLCAVLHTHLLRAAAGSRLRVLHRVRAALTRDEAAAAALFACRLYAASRRVAAVVLQRAWRAYRARHAAAARARALQARNRRLEEVRALRLLPAVQAKTTLYALLVRLQHPVCAAVAPLRGDTHELEEALRKQNYEVHVLDDATLPQLLDALARVPVTTSSCLVHILGYGGALRLRQPPLHDLDVLQLCIHEELCRDTLARDAARVCRALTTRCAAEALALQPRKRPVKDKKAAAAAAQKKAKTATTAAAVAATSGGRRGQKASGAEAATRRVSDATAAPAAAAAAAATAQLHDALAALDGAEQQAREARSHAEAAEWQAMQTVWQQVCVATDEYVRTFTSWATPRTRQPAARDHAAATAASHNNNNNNNNNSNHDNHNYGHRCSDHQAADGDDAAARAFVYPCECGRVVPYASTVLHVDALLDVVMRRRGSLAAAMCASAASSNSSLTGTTSTTSTSSLGMQCVLSVDLQPLTPYACGVAYLASSLGHVLRVPYKPEQRLLLTHTLRKAFEGRVPPTANVSKYAALTGAIAVAANERDWHALATYVLRKLHAACDVPPVRQHAMFAALQREVAFTAELVPVRDVVVSAEQRERTRRDREAQKVTVQLLFGVGSTTVQPDMFALFKSIVTDVPLTEVAFTYVVHILLAQHNATLDGVCVDDVAAAIEQCRPAGCAVTFALTVSSHEGVRVAFALPRDARGEHKAQLTQWLGAMVVRSLHWQFALHAREGGGVAEVDYLEYVYAVKTSCHVRRYRQLRRQQCEQPLPQPYVRFLHCDTVTGASSA